MIAFQKSGIGERAQPAPAPGTPQICMWCELNRQKRSFRTRFPGEIALP
jgi:hypothetical protein